MDRYPSEYLRDHVRYCTSALDGPTDESQAERWLDFTDKADLLMYGSSYPHWSTIDPDAVSRGSTSDSAKRCCGATQVTSTGSLRRRRKPDMTTVEARRNVAQDIAVTIVDTDVHPLPVSGDVLTSYAPPEWKDKLWPTGNAVSPMPYFYDTRIPTRQLAARRLRPPSGGAAGSDPDFAAKQLLVDAGVSIAVLEPMCDAQLPQAEHVLKSTYNDWLADVWLGDNNWHGAVAG